jgi:hypothetical protein
MLAAPGIPERQAVDTGPRSLKAQLSHTVPQSGSQDHAGRDEGFRLCEFRGTVHTSNLSVFFAIVMPGARDVSVGAHPYQVPCNERVYAVSRGATGSRGRAVSRFQG